MPKYPRTYHLPWSEGLTSDDKKISDFICLLGYTFPYEGEEITVKTPLIITEKLDGSNICFCKEGMFARSHSGPPNHESFDLAKSEYSRVKYKLDPTCFYYFEYMYAKHSIYYENLPSYLFLIGVFDEWTGHNGEWLPQNELEQIAQELEFPVVPVLANLREGVFSEKELKKVTIEAFNLPSVFGGEKEGIVVKRDGIDTNFSRNCAKMVRKNHVQTDEHWINQPIIRNKLNEN